MTNSETPPKGDVTGDAFDRRLNCKVGTCRHGCSSFCEEQRNTPDPSGTAREAPSQSSDTVSGSLPPVPSSPDATGLKPCPFCGSENLRRNSIEGIECRACHIEFYATGNELDADAWNRRAPPSPQVTREGTNNALIHDLREWASQALCATDEGTKILEAAASALTAADERIAVLTERVRPIALAKAEKGIALGLATDRLIRIQTLEAALAERDATIVECERQFQAKVQEVLDEMHCTDAAKALLKTAVRAGMEYAGAIVFRRDLTENEKHDRLRALDVAVILAQITGTKT